MSRTPNYDQKIQPILDNLKTGEETCAVTGQKWTVTEKEVAAYKKFKMPPVKLSPIVRHWIMTAMWPGGQWWYSKHPETGKPIISPVHPATGIKVLKDDEWFSRDFQEMNLELDLERSFFDQLHELRLKVPSPASRDFEKAENSISAVSLGDVNSYFVILSRSKNTFFSVSALDTEDSSEVMMSSAVQNSYHVVHSERVYGSKYIQESQDIMNSDFLFDCRNCENCFGATNARNKKFLWFNEQLTEEEWRKRRAEVDLGSRKVLTEYLKKFEELIDQAVWPENFNLNSEGCVGEYLTKATNCEYTYFADGGARDEYHTSFSIGKAEGNVFSEDPANSTNCYYSTDASSSNKAHLSYLVSRCQDTEYSIDCYDCENCFGCVGLRRKKFCILNKQYTEEEYWKKLDELKCKMLERGEYGQFMPLKLSPAYYPESGAYKYYDGDPTIGDKLGALNFAAEDAGALGEDLTNAKDVIDSKEIPDSVDELDGWAGKVLYDSNYGRRFAFLPQEIDLYKRLRVAPPTEHHIKRFLNLVRSGNSGKFDNAGCQNCGKKVVVSVNPHFLKRKIYCTACYLEHMEKTN